MTMELGAVDSLLTARETEIVLLVGHQRDNEIALQPGLNVRIVKNEQVSRLCS